MLNKDKGHIVTIASVAGYAGVSGLADYCASKFGAVGFDESIRMELRHLKSKVKTTCINPFYINTGMFDGVKSKFPIILPILGESYTSNRIVTAILQEEKTVMIPWLINTLLVLKTILPVSWIDSI